MRGVSARLEVFVPGFVRTRRGLAAELGRRAGLRAAGPTQQPRRSQSTATIPAGVHISIVSLLVNDVRHIALPPPPRTFETLITRPYLSCRGFVAVALGFEPPRGSGYGLYVVAGCDGQNRLAARCPATTRPLIERCDWIA